MALTRSNHSKILAGVCGGIAESRDWDPTMVRLVYLLGTVLTGVFLGAVVYVVLWVVIASPSPGRFRNLELRR